MEVKLAKSIFSIVLLCLFPFILSAQEYKTFLEQGQKLYNERQYDAAIKVLRAGLAGTDDKGKAELSDWIKKCNDTKSALAAKAKADRERFTLSTGNVSFFSEGGTYEITVDAAGDWIVSDSPEWCEMECKANALSVNCKANRELIMRTGDIRLKMTYIDGKTIREKYAIVSVSQDAREIETRQIRFVTVPRNASIRFPDDKISGSSSDTFSLNEGSHRAIISKPMYNSAEIVFEIDPEEKETVIYKHVDLEPQFSSLCISIKADDGSMISEEDMPICRIGEHYIDLSPYFTGRGNKTFDSEDEIAFYKMYDGNIIPVEPGIYSLSVMAENFYPFEDSVVVNDNSSLQVSIVLKPHKGLLQVFNGGGADGAKIFVDKKEVGVIPSNISLPKGSHVVEFSKPEYISEKKSYLVEIGDSDSQILDVKMLPYTVVTITSEPSHAEMHLDNDDVNIYTPIVNDKIAQGIHNYQIEKQGYLTQFGEVNITGDSLSLHYVLPEAFPLNILTDRDEELMVKVRSSDGKVLTTPDLSISEPIYLPYGKYYLELYQHITVFNQVARIADELVYKGKLDFHGQDQVKKLTFSKNRFALIGGTISTGVKASATGEGPINGDYCAYANAEFAKFELFKGYTTSLVKGSVFKNIQNNNSPEFLFSGTFAFLNGEMRIGGAIHDNLDISVLGSYMWTPSINEMDIISCDYVSGWNWFAGIELSSRIPIFNGYLRIGWNGINCDINSTKSSTGNNYTSTPLVGGAMMASIGFTLGGKDSKGASMIRVF